ncbi:hypothetical protein CEXT_325441 [Caerostris extrusa]|uniref:Uncharacterized protein n=1 Tax=Caerostris extrusa TaxID=172846 RepID=A0AAV4THW1_CAEEX|nr:hypothetical protein CEXT_325441 [Caerostris extrusa]
MISPASTSDVKDGRTTSVHESLSRNSGPLQGVRCPLKITPDDNPASTSDAKDGTASAMNHFPQFFLHAPPRGMEGEREMKDRHAIQLLILPFCVPYYFSIPPPHPSFP